MKIIAFGDSWAYGSELNEGEKPYPHWMAQQLGVEYSNYGVEGFSLGNVLQTIVANVKQIENDDIVTVIIPPDVRWYDESEEDGFHNMYSMEGTGNLTKRYKEFLGNKSLRWFEYHHAVFVYTIQKILNDQGCRYSMIHNYGQIDKIHEFGLAIDRKKFLDSKSLTEILTERNKFLRLFQTYNAGLWDGPAEEDFQGQYFEGCRTHPNELGHKRIARLFIEYFKL